MCALHDLDCESWPNTRVTIDLPCVSPTLEALLAQTTQLNTKSQKRLDYLEDKYDQPSKASKAVNKFVSAGPLALEPIVAEAVFELPKGTKEIVHRLRYQFAAKHRGDIDCVVVGELNGKQHVVLCEAKHDVTTHIRSAKSELIKAKCRWGQLCELSAELDNLNDVDQQDF